MPYKSYFLSMFLILTGLLCLAGCGSSSPPLAPVTGSVSYQGHLLNGGLIVFTPDTCKGGYGPMAHAEIQADGTFILHTDEVPGAVAGWHRVTVVMVHDPGPQQNRSLAAPYSLLPEKYCSPELSGVSQEVKVGQANEVHIELQ